MVSDTAFVGNTYTSTVIVLYGNMVFAMILRLVKEMVVVKNEVALNNFSVKLIYYDTIKFIML